MLSKEIKDQSKFYLQKILKRPPNEDELKRYLLELDNLIQENGDIDIKEFLQFCGDCNEYADKLARTGNLSEREDLRRNCGDGVLFTATLIKGMREEGYKIPIIITETFTEESTNVELDVVKAIQEEYSNIKDSLSLYQIYLQMRDPNVPAIDYITFKQYLQI